ncbi:ABC transporter substrate-binding protein [Actinokineospora diospyrosa]|uniref:Peptide/nickel transport system substrate-binding protein n=1 Tax=Actinokineospora diospyrosa TaxID=103728 RepID=A0ABT1IN44_9PSEU|nr:ABC transporter substrate-binding protein [Actinokineospora diospyrosa]MCP2274094.1 peptide/nickel transport system substrate-binding protein [Actinokineospora diospyrosa]
MRLRVKAGTDLPEPVAAHRHPLAALTRLHTRQLFTYRSDAAPGSWQSVAPVPDLATAIPSIYNAGLGARGTSYVIHLRRDARWDTGRPVTAHDVVRGLKRLCGPFHTSTALPYFLSTIRGMADYRDGHPASLRTAADLAEHANTHDIAGVLALDEHTLVVELEHPAPDIIDILALPCAAPVPVEYEAFLPDSPEVRAALRSTGPYRPVGIADGVLRFEPNPAWSPAADPVRGRHAEVITATPDETAADVDLTAEGEARAPLHGVQYLTLNTGGPLGEHTARLAIADTLDRIADTVIPPGNDGHHRVTATARGALPAPLSLTLAHRDTDAPCAARVTAGLAAVGMTIHSRPMTHEQHQRAMTGDRAGWDLLLTTWFPDWAHDNARVFLLPLLLGDPEGTALAHAALAVQDDPARSVPALIAVQQHALTAATVIPLRYCRPPAPPGVPVLAALGGLPDLAPAAAPLPSPRLESAVSPTSPAPVTGTVNEVHR